MTIRKVLTAVAGTVAIVAASPIQAQGLPDRFVIAGKTLSIGADRGFVEISGGANAVPGPQRAALLQTLSVTAQSFRNEDLVSAVQAYPGPVYVLNPSSTAGIGLTVSGAFPLFNWPGADSSRLHISRNAGTSSSAPILEARALTTWLRGVLGDLGYR